MYSVVCVCCMCLCVCVRLVGHSLVLCSMGGTLFKLQRTYENKVAAEITQWLTGHHVP